MAKRIVKGTVVVKRADPNKADSFKRVSPPIGSTFDFTADEIKDIDRITPGALVRVDAQDDPVDGPAAPAEAAPSGGGKTTKPAKPAKDDDDL